jgi:hypothetical protein
VRNVFFLIRVSEVLMFQKKKEPKFSLRGKSKNIATVNLSVAKFQN